MSKEFAKKVYDLISGQRFADFYAGDFESHITGQDADFYGISNDESKEKIINRLAELLRIDPHWCDETSHYRCEG